MKFLVAIDGSTASQHALEKALSLAKPSGADLVLLNVAEHPSSAYWPGVLPTGEPLPFQNIPVAELEESVRAVAEATLNEAREYCKAAGVSCEARLEFGSPRDTICDVAETERPDILIIGSRGLGNMQRLMLGSVSDYVIHHAPCPVLVVR